MNGKVGGSPCCGIRGFFFSRIVFVINTKGVAYLFIVFLTFINRGGKTVVHYYYNCIIKLKAERLKVEAGLYTKRAKAGSSTRSVFKAENGKQKAIGE